MSSGEVNEQSRAARLARIDATAREIFVAQFYQGDECDPPRNFYAGSHYDEMLAADCATSYRLALALERARDEAIRELDALPSKEPR